MKTSATSQAISLVRRTKLLPPNVLKKSTLPRKAGGGDISRDDPLGAQRLQYAKDRLQGARKVGSDDPAAWGATPAGEDPSSWGAKPAFDPSQPCHAVDTPAFDPSMPFEAIGEGPWNDYQKPVEAGDRLDVIKVLSEKDVPFVLRIPWRRPLGRERPSVIASYGPMSVAFTKEESAETASETLLPDRIISPHPNLVTEAGRGALEAQLGAAREAYETAQRIEEVNERRRQSAAPLRDMRYFAERLRTAKVVPAPSSTDTVAFGSTVTFSRADGRVQKYRIVGEDEADPNAGSISFVSPVAKSLMGKAVGEVVGSGNQELEIVAIS